MDANGRANMKHHSCLGLNAVTGSTKTNVLAVDWTLGEVQRREVGHLRILATSTYQALLCCLVGAFRQQTSTYVGY